MSGFKRHQSLERLEAINRAWGYLTPFQRARITLIVFWRSSPTPLQILHHIKYFYLRWLEVRLYPAHWIK